MPARVVTVNGKEYIKPSDLTDQLLLRKNRTTPDFLKIKSQEYYAFFTYGTLKKGGRFHHVLEGCPYLGESYIVAPTFEMYRTEGNFPIVFDRKVFKENLTGYVIGEVYVVPTELILELDRIENNGYMFRRDMKKYAFLTDQSYETVNGAAHPAVPVFMYLGIEENWDDSSLKDMFLNKSKSGKSGKTYWHYEWINR